MPIFIVIAIAIVIEIPRPVALPPPGNANLLIGTENLWQIPLPCQKTTERCGDSGT